MAIGEGMSEMLVTELFRSGHFIVVERAALDSVISEQALGQTGLVQGGMASTVGRMLGAQLLIKGVVSEFDEKQSSQDGSSVAGDPDWSADNEDTIDTLGLGISYAPAEENFRLGLEYTRSDATGEIRFADPSLTPLPDLESELDNIEIYGEYDYSDNLSYRASYVYEIYEEKNWYLDDVTPSTIDNVLTLGETSPDYRIGVVWFSMKYRF